MQRRDFLYGIMAMIGTSSIPKSGKAQTPWHVPPQYHTHSGTIMAMPTPKNWDRTIYKKAIDEYITVANTISDFETVYFAVHHNQRLLVEKHLSRNIIVWEVDITDGWARDTAPIFTINSAGGIRVNGFSFKGWGSKFTYSKDAKFKQYVAEALNIPLGYISPLEAEGGTFIHTKETVALTEESVFKGKRNVDATKTQMEQEIAKVFGSQKHVLWLEKGLQPDPITDGHIDGMAMFTPNNEVILQTTTDTSDPNYTIIESAREIFKNAHFPVIDLPLTDDLIVHVNSYICNDGLIVSSSGTYTDDTPLGILREVFSDRQVIDIPVNALMQAGGGIHCITQQIPKV